MHAKRRVEDLLSQNQLGSAKQLLLDAVDRLKLNDFYGLLARVEFAQGHYLAARDLAKRTTRLSPLSSEAWRIRALPEVATRNSAAALAYLKRASVAEPGYPTSYSTATTFFRTINNLPEAKRAIRRALLVGPEAADGLRADAALRYADGRLEEAADANKKAIIADPSNGRAYYLGTMLPPHDRPEIVTELQRALAISPTDDGPRISLIQSLTRHRRYEKLAREAQRLLLSSPGAEGAYQIMALYPIWKHISVDPLKLVRWFRPIGIEPVSTGRQLTLRLTEAGRDDETLDLVRYLAAIDPDDREGRYFLGVFLRRFGKYEEAEKIGRALINSNKEDKKGWLLLADVLKEQGHTDAAERVIKGGLKYTNKSYALWALYGKHLVDQDRHGRSVKIYQRALCEAPTLPEAYEQLARAYDAIGKEGWAATALSRGMRFKGKAATSIAALANMTLLSGSPLKALEQVEEAREIDPANASVVDVYVNVLLANERVDDALEVASDYLRLFPDRTHAISLYAMTLAQRGRFDESIALIREMMAKEPRSIEYVRAYTAVTTWMGSPGAGLDYQERIYRLRTKTGGSRTALAMQALWLGKWAKGYDEYETGFEQVKRGRGRKRKFTQPRWEGEDLAGKSIVVHTEQGVGDEIMFATLMPDIVKWASKVYIEATERMVPLFQAAFPTTTVFQMKPGSEYESDESIDYHVPIGSLGRYIRRKGNLFGRNRPYLSADYELSQTLRKKYKQKHGDDLVVGIGWRGGSMPMRRKTRSFEIADLKPILAHPGVTFVSVQYGDVEAEVEEVGRTVGKEVIYDPTVDPLKDLVAAASQIAACDLVISATNAGVHTAGGLAVPCWALVPFESDWRWTWGREDVVWYPGMRLFRQQAFKESWSTVIERVDKEFKALLGGDRTHLRAAPAQDLDW